MSDEKQIGITRAKGLNKLLKDVYGQESSIQQVLQRYEFCDADLTALREKTMVFLDAVNNSLHIALDDRCAVVLIHRYGLDDGNEKTLQDIASDALLSRERVRQIEDKAIRRLKTKLETIIARAACSAIGKQMPAPSLVTQVKVRREMRTDSLESIEQYITNEPVSRAHFIRRFVRTRVHEAKQFF